MSNKRYWQKTKGTKNFMKIVWKRLEVMIRFATEEDAEELLRIYSYYVENTAMQSTRSQGNIPSISVRRSGNGERGWTLQ